MAGRTRTTQKNPGWATKLLRKLEEVSEYEVAVGFPASATNQEELNKAIWNNYGTRTIPARDFMDRATQSVQSLWKDHQMAPVEALNRGEDVDVRASLEVAGQASVGEIVMAIDDTMTPPNAPATIRKKGSEHPLIDTGSMKQSATYLVRKSNVEVAS